MTQAGNDTAWHYGAANDLEKLVTTHLFIICPNNSGSTFLKNALATSMHTWNLMREGEHTLGFSGPSVLNQRLYRHWAADQRGIDIFMDPSAYDWSASRRAWYFQAYSRSREACVFVEKSPPFLLLVDRLVAHFRNARFLFMVRDPYAVVEGIIRKSKQDHTESLPLHVAASHVMNCFRYQRRNIEAWQDRGVFFSYETMCDNPALAEQLIKELVPELADVSLRQRLQVREYDEELRNMNAQQIARLSTDDRIQINDVFSRHQDLLDFFRYSLRD